jgi:signal transduction histidine kinase
MRLRSHLLLLSIATAAPVMILAAVVALLVVRQDRDTLRDAGGDRVVAVMSAIDAELRGSLATLRALAASSHLETGDLAAFHAEARRVVRAHPDWQDFTLAALDGSVVVDRESFDEAVTTGRPVIGGLAQAPNGGEWAIPLRMPVTWDGRVRYVLTAALRPDAFVDLLRAQRLPEGWVVAITDGGGRVIARLPPVPPGQEAIAGWREAVKRSPQGLYRGVTLEGEAAYTPYVTSTLSGWVLGIAMPAAAVDAAAWRSLWLVVLMMVLAAGIAVGLAVLIGRRIATPIAGLAAAADAAGRGAPVNFPARTPIAEIDSLAAALERAALAMREKQALAEREKQALQAADRAKDEFLAMLSHELRNPLAALTAAAHVLKLAPPSEFAAIKARAVVERQTKHMARLVGDLLDISRVAMGKVALQRERFDLREGVGNLLNVWRASGRLERHKLAMDLKPAWVDADRARIDQIVSNLLDNAVKFTPAGKTISVSVGVEDECALLRMSDEGEGLAPEAAERMFELFVQGERGLDRAAGGLGIGLALVKRLTELHGGRVAGSSAGPGRGATFTVKLPAAPAPAQATVEAGSRKLFGSRRVLIVEDNDDARAMLSEALAFSGHDVRQARDGATGLALAAQARPDIALIDIGLPDLDGYEVARRLRAAPGGGRIGLIAITGYGQAEDQRRAHDAGFDAHLTKPVAPERLRQVMAGL